MPGLRGWQAAAVEGQIEIDRLHVSGLSRNKQGLFLLRISETRNPFRPQRNAPWC